MQDQSDLGGSDFLFGQVIQCHIRCMMIVIIQTTAQDFHRACKINFHDVQAGAGLYQDRTGLLTSFPEWLRMDCHKD